MNNKIKGIKVGDVYNRWTVLEYAGKKYRKHYWLCRCSCRYETTKPVEAGSLINNKSKGCKRCASGKNLIGTTFGYITVLSFNKERTEREGLHTYYNVECKCGDKFSVRADSLTGGATTSCGCKLYEYEDLTGQKYGDLTIVEYKGRFSYSKTKDYKTSINLWKCECECGNTVTVRQGNLTSGNSSSCGCRTISDGERGIRKLLKRWKIPFIQEYRFDDCRYKKPLPFDFALTDENGIPFLLIEYDGIQHFTPIAFGDWTLEDMEYNYQITLIRDEIKNQYCLENNIPLIRIPYWLYEDGNLIYYLFDKLVQYNAIQEIKSAS